MYLGVIAERVYANTAAAISLFAIANLRKIGRVSDPVRNVSTSVLASLKSARGSELPGVGIDLRKLGLAACPLPTFGGGNTPNCEAASMPAGSRKAPGLCHGDGTDLRK